MSGWSNSRLASASRLWRSSGSISMAASSSVAMPGSQSVKCVNPHVNRSWCESCVRRESALNSASISRLRSWIPKM